MHQSTVVRLDLEVQRSLGVPLHVPFQSVEPTAVLLVEKQLIGLIVSVRRKGELLDSLPNWQRLGPEFRVKTPQSCFIRLER